MAIRTRTFECDGAQITVREPIGIDQIDGAVIYGKLAYDRTSSRDRNRAIRFGDMVMRTVSIVGEFAYPWATADSDEATTQKAFDAWLTWSESVMSKWQSELYAVAASPAPLATQPDIDPNASPLPT